MLQRRIVDTIGCLLRQKISNRKIFLYSKTHYSSIFVWKTNKRAIFAPVFPNRTLLVGTHGLFNMKKLQKLLLLLLFFTALFASCGRKESGQLVGVLDRPKWKGLNPYGMVYVPSGTLHVGTGDEDLSKSFVSRPKMNTVSLSTG